MTKNKVMFEEKSPVAFLLDESIKLFGNELVSVVLFGSHARKMYNKNSDMDLIIVLENNLDYKISKLRRDFLLRFEKKLDLHVFSKEEVIENFNNYSPLFSTLLLGKRILFDKNMFFKKQFENFVRKIINSNLNIRYCEGDKVWKMQKIARNLEISQ